MQIEKGNQIEHPTQRSQNSKSDLFQQSQEMEISNNQPKCTEKKRGKQEQRNEDINSDLNTASNGTLHHIGEPIRISVRTDSTIPSCIVLNHQKIHFVGLFLCPFLLSTVLGRTMRCCPALACSTPLKSFSMLCFCFRLVGSQWCSSPGCCSTLHQCTTTTSISWSLTESTASTTKPTTTSTTMTCRIVGFGWTFTCPMSLLATVVTRTTTGESSTGSFTIPLLHQVHCLHHLF
jgi:hypothetical protein